MPADLANAVPHSSDKDGDALKRMIRGGIFVYLGALIVILLGLIAAYGGDIVEFFRHIWLFGPIGVFGAVIASSTGTGGGVVFVPAFESLRMASAADMIPMELKVTPLNVIGISFLIQCYGMSIGSLTWTYRFYGGGTVHPADKIDGYNFLAIIFTVLATTLPALLITQFALLRSVDGALVITLFKWFSLVLGIILLVFTWALKRVKPYRFVPEISDTYWLLGLGAVGGVITAFFSVGVGELVAVYLIMRKFPTVAAVAAAVIISAATVLTGVWFHIAGGNIIWPIALTAVPGAMIGGYAARIFAGLLGPLWLKTFASVWIIFSSAFLIFLG